MGVITKACRVWAWTAAVMMAVTTTASASPYSEVASAFNGTDKIDIFVRLNYDWETRTAAIKREFAGVPGADPNGPIPVVKDLVFSSSRHTITPRLEIGLLKDFSAVFKLPIVVRDTRELSFDQRGDCVLPNMGQRH